MLFHAPWCGHCVQLMPVWSQLAELYRRVHSIVVASVDATQTQNEIPDLDVDQFPSIYLFDARGSPPVLYDGALDLDALSRFLKARGTRAFDVDGLRGRRRAARNEGFSSVRAALSFGVCNLSGASVQVPVGQGGQSGN